jgi:hypothetical protein
VVCEAGRSLHITVQPRQLPGCTAEDVLKEWPAVGLQLVALSPASLLSLLLSYSLAWESVLLHPRTFSYCMEFEAIIVIQVYL